MRQTTFNIVQVAVVVLIVMVLVAIVLPLFSKPRINSRRSQNSTQLRGIHQGLVTFANSNKYWFPGINELGEDAGISVENRFQILMEEDYISSFYAISPSETDNLTEWVEPRDPYDDSHPVTKDNYSYAMLQVPSEGGRRVEWAQTLSSRSIALSDRNTGTKAKPASIHTDKFQPWRGSVLWNDNHVSFEDDGDTFETFYGTFDPDADELNQDDRLFESTNTDDALMVHTGNSKE